jgi:hypothetical protein
MAEFGSEVVEDLQLMDIKLKQLKNEYEQYFLGSRQREPGMLRSEVQKMFAIYSNRPIQNTGNRFKFNNLRARFYAFRRHWDATLRKIEDGSYERHVFKANLRVKEERPLASGASKPEQSPAQGLFDAYISAREACGQGTSGITPDGITKLLKQQEEKIRAKLGCESVRFRVVVEDGRAKLKARAA